MLKFLIDRLEDVAESLRKEYAPNAAGKFVLQTEGEHPDLVTTKATLAETNGKLAEFRENNRGLKASLDGLYGAFKVTSADDLKTKFDGIDPAEVTALREKVTAFEKKGVKGVEDIGALVTAAVTAGTAPLRTQLETLQTQAKADKLALADANLDSLLTQAAIKGGVTETAIPLFLSHARQTWKVEDGGAVAKVGAVPIFSPAKPSQPITPDEWVGTQTTIVPFLFKASSGGGAHPAGGPGAPGAARTISIPAGQPIRLSAKDLAAVSKGEAVIQRT